MGSRYTGRDRRTVLEHVRELETLGIPPPLRVPSVYVVAPELITSESRIVVREPETSGEAEFVVLDTPHGALIGVGSDHTDRRRERTDIAASIFGGTLPTLHGFIFAKRFEVELHDPVLGRKLRCAYDVSVE